MKIDVIEYKPEWKNTFEQVCNHLSSITGFVHPVIEHIGSTSVEGLAAKPIIDILVGLNSDEDLDKIIQPLVINNYMYYAIYNSIMPYRRFFAKLTIAPQNLPTPLIVESENDFDALRNDYTNRLAHIHVLRYKSEHWIRHIAFRDYLRAHPSVLKAYQQLKLQLSMMLWKDGNDYNSAKDDFIKTEECNAINWYNSLNWQPCI